MALVLQLPFLAWVPGVFFAVALAGWLVAALALAYGLARGR
jgi:hypothetical protein